LRLFLAIFFIASRYRACITSGCGLSALRFARSRSCSLSLRAIALAFAAAHA
jgi:hypothetical protein